MLPSINSMLSHFYCSSRCPWSQLAGYGVERSHVFQDIQVSACPDGKLSVCQWNPERIFNEAGHSMPLYVHLSGNVIRLWSKHFLTRNAHPTELFGTHSHIPCLFCPFVFTQTNTRTHTHTMSERSHFLHTHKISLAIESLSLKSLKYHPQSMWNSKSVSTGLQTHSALALS